MDSSGRLSLTQSSVSTALSSSDDDTESVCSSCSSVGPPQPQVPGTQYSPIRRGLRLGGVVPHSTCVLPGPRFNFGQMTASSVPSFPSAGAQSLFAAPPVAANALRGLGGLVQQPLQATGSRDTFMFQLPQNQVQEYQPRGNLPTNRRGQGATVICQDGPRVGCFSRPGGCQINNSAETIVSLTFERSGNYNVSLENIQRDRRSESSEQAGTSGGKAGEDVKK